MTKLEAYQKCINEIDDYFEYRYVSVEDREFVLKCLARLLERLND